MIPLLVGMTLGVWVSSPAQPAYALSAACATANAGGYGNSPGNPGILTFEAGETVVMNFTMVAPGNTGGYSYPSGGPVILVNTNQTIQVTIVAPNLAIDIYAETTSNATVALSCIPVASANGPVFGAGLDPNGDADGDTIINSRDNCATNRNPDQLDSFGGINGDACDNEFFDNGNGIKIFQQKDGSFAVFACGAGGCREIARVIPGQLSPNGGTFTFQGTDAQGWSVQVTFETFGSEIYRMTVLAPGGGIAESRFQIVINNDGTVSWRVAGGGVATGRASGGNTTVVDRSISAGGGGGSIPAGAVVTTSALRVHLEPNPDAIERADSIPFGALVTVVRTDESGLWAFVRTTNGVEGWVLNGYFREFRPGVDDAIAEPFTANPNVRPGSDGQANGPINVRNAPSEDAALVAQLPQGLVVRVVAEDPTGLWFRVQTTGVDGWAANVGFSPVGTVGRLTPSSSTPVKVGDNAITVSEVNGRSGASSGAEVLFIIPRGTEVRVTALQSGFANVSFSGGSAWVSTSGLAAFNALGPTVISNQPASQAPAAPAPASNTASQSNTQTQVRPTAAPSLPETFTANRAVRPGDCAAALGTLNIRQDPSLSAAVLGQIAWGTRADILAEDPSGFWFKVRVLARVTDADGNQSVQTIEGWASNEWFGRPGDFIERGGGVVPNVCS
jgi:uncharacterized protein YgiM (DUF1202 family)